MLKTHFIKIKAKVRKKEEKGDFGNFIGKKILGMEEKKLAKKRMYEGSMINIYSINFCKLYIYQHFIITCICHN